MGRRVGEVSSIVSWALPGQTRLHAVLVIVEEACKPGEGGSDHLYGYPKRSVGQML